MSMMNCESCGVAIDTDFNAEVIREDMADKVVCDKCWSETNEEGELE